MTDAELRSWALAHAPAMPQAVAVLRVLDDVARLRGLAECLARRAERADLLPDPDAAMLEYEPADDPEATWDLADAAAAGRAGAGGDEPTAEEQAEFVDQALGEWEAYLQGEYRGGGK